MLCGLQCLWSTEKFWDGPQCHRRGRGKWVRKYRKTASHHPKLSSWDLSGPTWSRQNQILHGHRYEGKGIGKRSEVQCRIHLKALSHWGLSLLWSPRFSPLFHVYLLHSLSSSLILCILTIHSAPKNSQESPPDSVFKEASIPPSLCLKAEENAGNSLCKWRNRDSEKRSDCSERRSHS